MSSATTTTQLPLQKRLWGQGVSEPLYKRSKVFAKMQKDTDFGSEGRYVIVTVAPTTGGSANFGDAVANQGPTQEKRFFVTHRKEYQVFSIQGDLIARTKGNKNAVLEALKQQADKARYAFARSMAARLWGNGGGSLGRLDSTTTLTGTTLKLRTRADFVRFEPGMYINFSSDDGSSSSPAGLRDSGKQLQIVDINTQNSGFATFTMSANLNTVAGITANDYIFRGGDYALAWSGIPGWNPVTQPGGSDSFMGLNRSGVHVQRLAGTIVSGGGKPKEDTLEDAMAEARMAGIDDEMVVCVNPLDLKDLFKEQGSKVVIDVGTDNPKLSFKAVSIMGPAGVVLLLDEPDVPQGYFWIEPMGELYCRSAGDVPMMLNEDGVGRLLRAADDDAYQGRLGAYGNFFHENPGHAVIGSW